MKMATLVAEHPFSVSDLTSFPQYGTVDDFAAMAVLASLSLFYFLYIRDKPDPNLYRLFERPQEKLGICKAAETTRDVALKLEQVGADMVIFWGSQSGTCERLANRLSKEIRQRFGKRALAADLFDYEPSTIANISETKLAIFLVSTYGEGEPSDNSTEFLNWFESNPTSKLSNLMYAALGLGNSNYKYYNAVVDLLADKLSGLDAHEMLGTGRADDAKGETEEHYLSWKTSLFDMLKAQLGYEEHDPVYEPSIEVVEGLASTAGFAGAPWTPNENKKMSRNMSPNYPLAVRETRELFTDASSRKCLHMEIDLNVDSYASLKYKTGDHLGVWAANPAEEVDSLLSILGLTSRRSTAVSIEQQDTECRPKVPTPTTIEALLTHYLEICAPISRETMSSLVQFAPNTSAKDALSRLSSDKAAYSQLLGSRYINVGRLLEILAPGEGSWKDLPLSFIIEALPAMRPRYYSISSSSVVQPKSIAITAVVADQALSEDTIPGLCTNYLLGRKVRQGSFSRRRSSVQVREKFQMAPKLFAHVRKSTFKLPTLSTQPIVMVGAGTGVAPFRAFLQERARLARMGREIGRTILLFGCRNESQDYIYREELQALQEEIGDACTIITAFSRPDNGAKAYVQDCVTEHAAEVCEMLVNGGANFYICGSAAMARDVSQVVSRELSSRQGWNDDELRVFSERRRKQRSWQQDVWG